MPVSTRKHLEALRAADQRAITIKDEAEERARSLALESQRYRDDQHNKLREQIAAERGEYVPLVLYNQRHESLEVEIRSIAERLTEFIAASTGRSSGTTATWATLVVVLTLILAAAAIIVTVLTH